jgi:hypothetical protein
MDEVCRKDLPDARNEEDEDGGSPVKSVRFEDMMVDGRKYGESESKERDSEDEDDEEEEEDEESDEESEFYD